jgi:hypothetical protein
VRMHQFGEFVDQILDAMSPAPGVADSHGTGTRSGPS